MTSEVWECKYPGGTKIRNAGHGQPGSIRAGSTHFPRDIQAFLSISHVKSLNSWLPVRSSLIYLAENLPRHMTYQCPAHLEMPVSAELSETADTYM